MQTTTQELLRLVQALPPDEQEELLTELALSLGTRDKEIERAWEDEALRRWLEIESGEADTIPWLQIRREIADQFGV
jgi:putative addiction module component (TIGR02574 family)